MKKLVILFTLILFIISCGDKTREEITERYPNGDKLLLVKYKGEGGDEIVVERIGYSRLKNGIWKSSDSTGLYIDGKKDGKWTWYNKDGSVKEVVEYPTQRI